jgi:hypothetical protein
MANNTSDTDSDSAKQKSVSREPATTQRAYTLRLHGIDKSDHAWRDAVWTTHEAVNNGAKVFGDWLLTLRGGLHHALADVPQIDLSSEEGKKLVAFTLKDLAKAKNKDDAEPTELNAIEEIENRRNAQIRDRRILLALSWLSVESSPKENDAYKDFKVACGKDSDAARIEKVISALQKILTRRGVKGDDLESWKQHCEPSISAKIRDDAVWVNRSEIFDHAQKQVGPSLTRDEVWDLLEPFFGSRESYLTPITAADDSDDAAGEEDKAKDLVQKAGQWLSSRFGTGGGADFSRMSKVYNAMVAWAARASSFASGENALHSLAESLVEFSPKANDGEGILKLIGGPGYKSATRNIITKWQSQSASVFAADVIKLKESAAGDAKKCNSNTGGKGRRPYSDKILEKVQSVCGFTYLQAGGPARHSEFAVMLDHAARRVSIGHTWIKRAESERQKFKTDSEKIEKVPADIRAWLNHFCEERSKISGAIDGYGIRRRAIGRWKETVDRWDKSDCKTVEDRIVAAREVQANPDIDAKPGDNQLFEALAAEDAIVVWRVNGNATPQPLLDYAAATDALAKQKRFKVPAYRHPDPLSHPVFCDFGNSRWEIRFAVHDAASKLTEANATSARRKKELAKAQERVAKAKTPEKQTEAESKLNQAEHGLSIARDRVAWLAQRHALSMELWDGGKLGTDIPLRWSCKRLTENMNLKNPARNEKAIDVTRGDRLGRAAAGADEKSLVNILGVFGQADWNGRLQAPRSELDAIAKRVNQNGWDVKAKAMRDRISWLVSFSAKLQQAGPWFDYSAKFPEDADAKPFVSRRGEYAIKHADNDKRAGQAKLILSRLPSLRELSIDLGHRFAAAGVVWETLSHAQLLKEIEGREIIAGGTSDDDLYLHTHHIDAKTGKPRTTIYRRIGASALPDGKPHPAPWARLDRQFLIKLPGEEKPARRASDAEIVSVRHLEDEVGRKRTDDDALPLRVDELMSEAARTIRLGLRRLGDAARIAYAFMPGTEQHTPGGGKKPHTPETRKIAVLEALIRWYELRGDGPSSRWIDPIALRDWDAHIGSKLFANLPVFAQDASSHDRKKYRAELEKALEAIAGEFSSHGELGTPGLFKLWQERWEKDSAAWALRLKWLRKWLLPRGLRSRRSDSTEMADARKARRGTARNVGGLSLDRIATIRELYQVQKAYHYRPHPNDPRAGAKLVEDESAKGRKFGDRALQAMERMREQRVKQLASRIVAGALGLGGHWKQVDTRRKKPDGTKRMKSVWVEESTPKYDPCHAIAIEDLTNYRPEEMQTRRENRQLMVWSSSKVKKYLSEACQLHGLHLRQIQPGYTSKQDSRTGAPGCRCVDAPINVQNGTVDAYRWSKTLSAAEKKVAEGSKDAESNFLLNVANHLRDLKTDGRSLPSSVRIPRKGGDLFVAAPTWHQFRRMNNSDIASLAKKSTQADLNAAANIGLKALMDPDWPGKWWFVPCESATNRPHPDKTKGSLALKHEAALTRTTQLPSEQANVKQGNKSGRSKSPKKQREIVNLWRDISASPVDSASDWKSTAEYWNDVRARVVAMFQRTINSGEYLSVESTEAPW